MRPIMGLSGSVSALLACFLVQGCSKGPTPEQVKQAGELRQQLAQVRLDIENANNESAKYSGGILKQLIAIRQEVLATNAALLEQRINALESGVRISLSVQGAQPNPVQAAAIAKEIVAQTSKVTEAEAESARYEGGMVKALAEMAVATQRSSLAMLQQQYLVAQYGIAVPVAALKAPPQAAIESATGAGEPASVPTEASSPAAASGGSTTQPNNTCVKIGTYDSSVLSSNDSFVELAWKADVENSCDVPARVKVLFQIFDKDEFELDSDSKTVFVEAHDVGKARGKMLVSPPEKARRMAKQGVAFRIE